VRRSREPIAQSSRTSSMASTAQLRGVRPPLDLRGRCRSTGSHACHQRTDPAAVPDACAQAAQPAGRRHHPGTCRDGPGTAMPVESAGPKAFLRPQRSDPWPRGTACTVAHGAQGQAHDRRSGRLLAALLPESPWSAPHLDLHRGVGNLPGSDPRWAALSRGAGGVSQSSARAPSASLAGRRGRRPGRPTNHSNAALLAVLDCTVAVPPPLAAGRWRQRFPRADHGGWSTHVRPGPGDSAS